MQRTVAVLGMPKIEKLLSKVERTSLNRVGTGSLRKCMRHSVVGRIVALVVLIHIRKESNDDEFVMLILAAKRVRSAARIDWGCSTNNDPAVRDICTYIYSGLRMSR